MQFYPENSNITINPLIGSGELHYILSCPHPITKKEITIKFAFDAKWKITSQALKARLRDILVHILDIGHFQIAAQSSNVVITVPLKPLSNKALLPSQGIVEVPIVIKLYKKSSPEDEGFQVKCYQVLSLNTNFQPEEEEEEEEEEGEEYLDIPEKLSLDDSPPNGLSLPERMEERDLPAQDQKEVYITQAVYSLPEVKEGLESANEVRHEEISVPEMDVSHEESVEEKEIPRNIYSGIVTIDFGTTNSVVVVRDPLYAAEEIKEDLSKEQWNSISKWTDSWIIQHLSGITPTEEDLFLEEAIRYVPEMDLPPCGSLSVDIWEELQKIGSGVKEKFIVEMLSQFSDFDSEKCGFSILRELASELMGGFERSIYSKTLHSQRYFILELDDHAGPGPISSAMQIVAAPQSEDQKKLDANTEVEMGARVHLLMRSAALREADIRQFAITVKRYFGQDQSVEIVPSEAASTPIGFNPDTLCRLAYKKLIERALVDIKRRSQRGEFKYGDTIVTLVATFPTTYPASLRRRLRDMMNELEIEDIDTRYDEGTASAIYYIWREVCSDPICAMHGLMARCRRDRHGRSYQNILLYDLGGGTTDIALIQLSYEELPIFEPIDKTKAEGRYFRITPRLLGSTGHRYIGGDLITLWLFRLVKSKLADCFLALLVKKEIEPPTGSEFSNFYGTLPEELLSPLGTYRSGLLLEWIYEPIENMRQYEVLNNTVINKVIPTTFESDAVSTPNFFTLWELTEDIKKRLGTPVSTYVGSGLGNEWIESVELDYSQLWRLMSAVHPWIEQTDIQPEDFKISISQEELYRFASGPVVESLNLAINLAKARLRTQGISDKIDRLILSGLSCNLKVIQEEAKSLFRKTEGLFDFNLANVFFEPEVAKTSVAMGACIGRYLESVRLDPTHEKTRQMLREGYDQVELVVENLFSHLACSLVYDSLVAMVQIFDHGQELNQRSIKDRKPVARTPMNALKPVQEKFWIYRVDFEGASPQYLGLINAERVAYENGFEDFRKFREQYVVGFEADAELFVKAFFMPRGPKNILALNFMEDPTCICPARHVIDPQRYPVLSKTISSQELFNRRGILLEGTQMIDTIEYPDGSKYRCVVSEALPLREMYDFYLEDVQEVGLEPQLIGHFHLAGEDADEVMLSCDETGRIVLLLSAVYDIKIWADIDYLPQKVDAHYDPFCGQH